MVPKGLTFDYRILFPTFHDIELIVNLILERHLKNAKRGGLKWNNKAANL